MLITPVQALRASLTVDYDSSMACKNSMHARSMRRSVYFTIRGWSTFLRDDPFSMEISFSIFSLLAAFMRRLSIANTGSTDGCSNLDSSSLIRRSHDSKKTCLKTILVCQTDGVQILQIFWGGLSAAS